MRLHASVVALALFGCAPSEPPRECARAVSGDAPFAIELGSVGGETHALPTADRWALVLEDTNHAAVPCAFPGTAENPTYELDEVAFD